MFKIKIKADTKAERKRFERYKVEMGQDLRKILYRRARLLAVRLAFVTMPRGFSGKVKKKAELDLAGDLRKCAKSLKDFQEGFQKRLGHPWFDKLDALVQAKDISGIQVMLRNSQLANKLKLDSTFSKPMHRSQRQKGKVNHATEEHIVGNASSLNRYLRAEKNFVGSAKGGWASAASSLGGTQGIPRWVSRHVGRSGGTAKIDLTNPSNMVVEIINTVSYIDEIMRKSSLYEAEADAAKLFEKHIALVVRHGTKWRN